MTYLHYLSPGRWLLFPYWPKIGGRAQKASPESEGLVSGAVQFATAQKSSSPLLSNECVETTKKQPGLFFFLNLLGKWKESVKEKRQSCALGTKGSKPHCLQSLMFFINLIHSLIKKIDTRDFFLGEKCICFISHVCLQTSTASFLHIKWIKNLCLNNNVSDNVYF